MKKIQVPAIGGLRKVIVPGGTTSSATTIVGLEGTTLTLAQLAQLLGLLTTNNGGGNIGSGDEGAIVLGPGLAGGGPLVGAVPIRLTAPIPWLGDDGGGGDGDPGPPGQAGAAGSQGIPGVQGPPGSTILVMIPEDGQDGETYLVPGIPGPQGATGATGATGGTGSGGSGGGSLMFMVPEESIQDDGLLALTPNAFGPIFLNGPVTVAANTNFTFTTKSLNTIIFQGATPALICSGAGGVFQIESNTSFQVGVGGRTQDFLIQNAGNTLFGGSGGAAGAPQIQINASHSGGASEGIQINAGTNTNDYSIQVNMATGSPKIMQLYGDGGLVMGTATDQGRGTINVQNDYYVNGVPLSKNISQAAAGAAPFFIADDTHNDDGMISVGAFAPIMAPNVYGPMSVTCIPVGPGQVALSVIGNGTQNALGITGGNSLSPLVLNGTNTTGYGYGIVFQGGATGGTEYGWMGPGPRNVTGITTQSIGIASFNGAVVLGAVSGTLMAAATATSAANPAITINGTYGAEALQVNGVNPATGISINCIGTGSSNYIQAATTTTAGSPGVQFSWGGLHTGFYGISPGSGFLVVGDSPGDLCFVNSIGRMLYSMNNGTTCHFYLATNSVIASGPVGTKGVTPAVTAGQTDVGTTTTATVITTAGGIALPALASTFWVVNVNGVKYGIPCFAL